MKPVTEPFQFAMGRNIPQINSAIVGPANTPPIAKPIYGKKEKNGRIIERRYNNIYLQFCLALLKFFFLKLT